MDQYNQAITGICSFGKYPICTNLDQLQVNDIAVLGIPYDLGSPYLNGSRLGPRKIREASVQYGRGETGFYNFETDELLLASPIHIFDCGDVDVLHGNIDYCYKSIETTVRKLLERQAIPAMMGGDHSILTPIGRALSACSEDICIIQIDSHLDWTDHVGPQYYGNGSPMRRLSEMKHITKMVQIGLRGMGSSKKKDFEDAKNFGSILISSREFHNLGVKNVLDLIPMAKHYYITFDIDGYDISLVPGTGAPLPGGLFFDETMDLIEGICQRGGVIGFDINEVAPLYDPTGITSRLAAITMITIMSKIVKYR